MEDKLCFTLVIFIGLISTGVYGLKCYICSSVGDAACLGPDIASKYMPVECRDGYNHCTSYTGYFRNNERFTVRKCVDEPVYGCKDIELEGEQVNACYTNCETDACNGDLKVAVKKVEMMSSGGRALPVFASFCILPLLMLLL